MIAELNIKLKLALQTLAQRFEARAIRNAGVKLGSGCAKHPVNDDLTKPFKCSGTFPLLKNLAIGLCRGSLNDFPGQLAQGIRRLLLNSSLGIIPWPALAMPLVCSRHSLLISASVTGLRYASSANRQVS